MRLRWWGIDIMLIDSSVWQRQVHKRPGFPSLPLDLLSCATFCFSRYPILSQRLLCHILLIVYLRQLLIPYHLRHE